MDTATASSKDCLIFIYNANSGFMNMLKDWTHKIVSPSTYDCQLCALTYGNTGMRKKWHRFISDLSMNTLFLHRDEFYKQYSNLKDLSLPCILIQRNHDQSIQVLLNAEIINQQQTLDQLIDVCHRSMQSFSKS